MNYFVGCLIGIIGVQALSSLLGSMFDEEEHVKEYLKRVKFIRSKVMGGFPNEDFGEEPRLEYEPLVKLKYFGRLESRAPTRKPKQFVADIPTYDFPAVYDIVDQQSSNCDHLFSATLRWNCRRRIVPSKRNRV